MRGLTYPYLGGVPCSRLYLHGYTFRLVKGDRYVVVFEGTCVETRRSLIVRDALAGHRVVEGPRPIRAVLPVTWTDWADDRMLRAAAERWVRDGAPG